MLILKCQFPENSSDRPKCTYGCFISQGKEIVVLGKMEGKQLSETFGNANEENLGIMI